MKTLICLFILLFASFTSWAATPAGQVIMATGDVKANARALTRGSDFYPHETLQTGDGSQARIRFTDGTLVAIHPNTQLRVDDYDYSTNRKNYAVTLVTGGFRTISGAIAKQHPENYQVLTPVGTIAVRGTDYSIHYRKRRGLFIAVWNGAIRITTKRSALDIGDRYPFRFAKIDRQDASPKGLTEMPGTFADDTVLDMSSSLATSPQQPMAPSLSKRPLLEICIP